MRMNLLKVKHSYRKILSMATSYKAKENSWDAMTEELWAAKTAVSREKESL